MQGTTIAQFGVLRCRDGTLESAAADRLHGDHHRGSTGRVPLVHQCLAIIRRVGGMRIQPDEVLGALPVGSDGRVHRGALDALGIGKVHYVVMPPREAFGYFPRVVGATAIGYHDPCRAG